MPQRNLQINLPDDDPANKTIARAEIGALGQDDLDAHIADSGAHGATANNTANAIVRRDANGRSRFSDLIVHADNPNGELDVSTTILEASSTGVIALGSFSVVNGTTINIGRVVARIVDNYTDPTNSDNWTYSTVDTTPGNVTITNAASQGITYLSIDPYGVIIQSLTQPTPAQMRDNAFIGRAIHTSGTVTSVFANPSINTSIANQIREILDLLGIVNVNISIGSVGGSLSMSSSGGSLLVAGGGFLFDAANPNRRAIPASTPVTLAYITQLVGSTEANRTTLDPTYYDVGGVKTAIPGANTRATLQRVYLAPSGLYRVAYGQAYYNSLTDAIQSSRTEIFTQNPSIAGNLVLLGTWAVTKGCTDLANTASARWLPASRFGEGSVGGSGLSVTSFQNAYDNSIDGNIDTSATPSKDPSINLSPILTLANQWVGVPANASASGIAGQRAFDSAYEYLCVDTNTWTRKPHATW